MVAASRAISINKGTTYTIGMCINYAGLGTLNLNSNVQGFFFAFLDRRCKPICDGVIRLMRWLEVLLLIQE
jgi:hypothetical protein